MLQIKRPIVPTENSKDEDKQETEYENDLTDQRMKTTEDQVINHLHHYQSHQLNIH